MFRGEICKDNDAVIKVIVTIFALIWKNKGRVDYV